ncbi:glycosyltransferase [Verrucomicrobiales bacterium]|nr:glycosyltransferase [Verrucomicrobiales bacterium]MDB4358909.1 glycosyltransferase [Verrucomicrobiales bacterium]
MCLLSVILPAYNAERHLAEAVRSVLAQSFSDFELIVINDGSSDRTADIIREIDDSRIRLIQHDQNSGLIAVLNEGISLAKGRFIARMDADDICEISRFEEQLAYFEANPNVGVLGTAIKIIDDEGRGGKVFEMPLLPEEIEWALPLFCPVAHPSVMMRADIIREAGGYSSSAELAEDYELWGRMAKETAIANLSSPLLKLRKHPESVTSSRVQEHLRASALVSKGLIDSHLNEDIALETVQCLRSSGSTESGNADAAVKLLLRLFSLSFQNREKSDTRGIRRDVAIRIFRLANKTSDFKKRLHYFRIAHKFDRNLIVGLLKRGIEQYVPQVKRHLIG